MVPTRRGVKNLIKSSYCLKGLPTAPENGKIETCVHPRKLNSPEKLKPAWRSFNETRHTNSGNLLST